MYSAVSWHTVNPRVNPLCAYVFLILFLFGGLFEGRELIKLFDKCRIKSSFSKLLFSILLQEQSIFKH